MKTDDLIDLLSTGVAPVDRRALARRFVTALVPGLLGSLLLMLAIYGIRPDLRSAAHTPMFWAKLAYPLCLAVGALLLVLKLGRPGARVGHEKALVVLPFIVVWIAGAFVLQGAESGERLPLVLGQSWRSCPFNILLLSVPVFPAVIWIMRGLAPTRLTIAGAAAGLLASALATLVYCLHCPEMSPAFWSVWYALGLLAATGIGALLGPRLLRW